MGKELRKTLSHQLADRILNRIMADQLPDGEVFMTEERVAEEFQVSRTVAREAVGRLRAFGIIEGRQRVGLIVRRPDPVRLFSAVLPSLAKSKKDIHELAHLRYALEVGAIELVIRNASDEQIDRLTELSDQFSAGLSRKISIKKQKELEVAFHQMLLEMTGSRMIAGMQSLLVEFFRDLQETESGDEEQARTVQEHKDLVDAIRRRDVEAARTVIRTQIGQYLDGSCLRTEEGHESELN